MTEETNTLDTNTGVRRGPMTQLESARNIPQEVLSALGFGDKQRKTNSFQERTEGRGAGEGETVYNVGEGVRVQKPEEEEDSSFKISKLGDRGSGREGVRVPAQGQEPEFCRGWCRLPSWETLGTPLAPYWPGMPNTKRGR